MARTGGDDNSVDRVETGDADAPVVKRESAPDIDDVSTLGLFQ